MTGVLDDAFPSACASLIVDIQQWKQWDTDNPLCCLNHSAPSLCLFCSAVPIPGSDTVCEDALDGPAIEHSSIAAAIRMPMSCGTTVMFF